MNINIEYLIKSSENGIYYITKAGDTIKSIAEQYGIDDWKEIYDHKKNEDLRDLFPDPEKLNSGEQIWIPIKNLSGKGKTGETLNMRVSLPRHKIQIIDYEGKPLVNTNYVLSIDNIMHEGTTDGEGWTELFLLRKSHRAIIYVEDIAIEVYNFGDEEISKEQKAQSILNSIGFNAGMCDGTIKNRSRKALMWFQEQHRLPATGSLDSETLKKLKEQSGED